jgi:hypothetical protein
LSSRSRSIAAASSSSRRAKTSTCDFHGALDRDRQAAERTAGCTCGGRVLGARFGAQVDEGVQLGLDSGDLIEMCLYDLHRPQIACGDVAHDLGGRQVQQVVSPHGAPPIRPRPRF